MAENQDDSLLEVDEIKLSIKINRHAHPELFKELAAIPKSSFQTERFRVLATLYLVSREQGRSPAPIEHNEPTQTHEGTLESEKQKKEEVLRKRKEKISGASFF